MSDLSICHQINLMELIFYMFRKQRRIKNPCQTSQMEIFVNTLNDRKPLTIVAKVLILDI